MNGHKLKSKQIADFKGFLVEEERSAATIEKYLHAIREFSCWLEGKVVSKQAVIAWECEPLLRNLTPATVNAKLCAMNSLL